MQEQWKIFEPERRTVKTFENWIVVQRPRQVTLGSCVFLPKRTTLGLSGATPSELGELAAVTAWFEDRTTTLFQAEKFNYVAAMMQNPHLHINAFPRYSTSRAAFGRTWEDVAWPKTVQFEYLATQEDLSDQIVQAMRDE
jgi:diadenosine tetraphosphate (Ap4A) HIT family hydrolase